MTATITTLVEKKVVGIPMDMSYAIIKQVNYGNDL